MRNGWVMMRKAVLFVGVALVMIALAAADTTDAWLPGAIAFAGLILMLIGGVHKIAEEIDIEEIADRDSEHINRVMEFEKRERKRKR